MPPAAQALLKILLLLIGSWAECRLKKLLYEPSGFDQVERLKITSAGSQYEQWRKALEIGFRRRHAIPRAPLRQALPAMAGLVFAELQSAIETDLRPLIEMRNTLAHGQWARPLNQDGTDVVAAMVRSLNAENALSARFKISILERLSAIIHDLVSGNHAFERDFDQHYKRLENARRNLRTRGFAEWQLSMEKKFDRGRQKRDRALQAAVAIT